jgi:type VI secretion system secreted protein VgrG
LRAKTVIGSEIDTIRGSQTITVKGSVNETTVKDHHQIVTGGRTASVSKDDALKVGQNLAIEAADSISITCGKASIVLKKDGTIQIVGKDITVEGKGDVGIMAKGAINSEAKKDMVLKGKNIHQN